MKVKERIWILALLAGFLFAYGVIVVPVGIGAFLFFNVMLGLLWYIVRGNEVDKDLPKNSHSNWVVNIFMGFYVLLSLSYLYRLDPMVNSSVVAYHIAFLGLYVVFGVFPALIQVINPFSALIHWMAFGLNWIVSIFKSAVSVFQLSSSRVRFMLKVILYITASLVVFIVFATLLSQADPNFRERILRILESIRFGEVVVRTFIGVIVLFVLGGLFKMLTESSILNIIGLRKEVMDSQFEKLKTFVHTKDSDAFLPLLITFPIVLIFGLFVYLQFKYLFAVDINTILSSLNFAQYAQKGFIELLVVVGLTYPVVAWVTNFSRSKSILPRMLNFIVVTLIVGCVFVMLYSALTRMGIYSSFYGPSVKRNYVVLAIGVLGIGMLGYEALALWKALKPEKSIINSLFVGDFIVWAGILGVTLLSTVALFPWNNATFGQIKSYYQETGKLDIYQIGSLSTEVTRDIYIFAEELEAKNADKINGGSCFTDQNCPSAGIKLLKLRALGEKEDYKIAVNQSLFTRVFGLNVTGLLIETLNTPNYNDYSRDASQAIQAEYKQVADRFSDAIRRNDFDAARKLYDPKMVANNIESLRSNVRISFTQERDYDYLTPNEFGRGYAEYGPKYKSFYYVVDFTRLGTLGATTQQMAQTAINKPVVNDQKPRIEVRVGLRNGKAFVVYSNFALAYLPDAIFSKENQYGEAASNLSTYGYQIYCEVPNAAQIFGSSQDDNCYSPSFPIDDLRAADFNIKK